MYPARQVFFVLGLSRSGCSATEFLLMQKSLVYIYDEGNGVRLEQTVKALVQKGAKALRQEDLPRACEVCDVLVLSPGIPIDHPIAIAFRRKGKGVIGETELAARYLKNTMIAVTGTNGKTTVVSMLTDVLNRGGLTAKACGNIGLPMIECYNMTEQAAVAEISSFQL